VQRLAGTLLSLRSQGGVLPRHGMIALQTGAKAKFFGRQFRFFSSDSGDLFIMKVPQMGESITEGSIQKWNKQIGDFVEADEVVCVIETDKVSIDVHAPRAGKVVAHGVDEGGTVFVGGDLVKLDTSATGGGQAAAPKAEASEATQAQTQTAAPSAPAAAAPSPGSGGRHRVPMIRFPDRSQGGGGHGTSAASAASSASPGSSAGGPTKTKDTVEFFDDWTELPDRLKPQPLTEEEIEAINNGGLEPKEKWVTKTLMKM